MLDKYVKKKTKNKNKKIKSLQYSFWHRKNVFSAVSNLNKKVSVFAEIRLSILLLEFTQHFYLCEFFNSTIPNYRNLNRNKLDFLAAPKSTPC